MTGTRPRGNRYVSSGPGPERRDAGEIEIETKPKDERIEARPGRRITAAILLVAIGFGLFLRIRAYDFSVFGDELSTIWIVTNHGFIETLEVVATNAEITPPSYFLLAWLAMKLGSAPELVRLPALIAGTATIPMVWLLGRRTIGNLAGLIAACLVAVSPYMVFFAAYGRAYSLMVFFLVASTLSMLAAVRTGRTRWWVAYALTTCMVMYSHYTGAFVLAGQLVWLLVTQPSLRKPALLSNLGAFVLFLPWIPQAIEDNDSPTTRVMEFLQPKGFSAKLDAVKETLFSMPIHPTIFQSLKGTVILVSVAIGAALVVALVRYLRDPARESWRSPRAKMVALVLVLALATPICQLLLLPLGTDLFGSRNLAAAWPGIALAASFVLAAAGPVIGVVLAAAAIFGYSYEAVQLTERDKSFVYKSSAAYIDREADPEDVVIDAAHFTPVPLTGLDAYLPRTRREFRLNQPQGPPPFLPFISPVAVPQDEVDKAFRIAGKNDSRVFAVTTNPAPDEDSRSLFFEDQAVIPRGWEVESVVTYQGVEPQTVTVFRRVED